MKYGARRFVFAVFFVFRVSNGVGAVPDPDKRMLRDLKRALKKRGNKHRRAELKKNLANNPEEAAHAEEDLGRHRSDTLNKLDNDSTRKKKDEEDRDKASE
jgi:hypothetical protein